MARIRSIHPSLCTDEIYMVMTLAAKAAWPLVWMQCDDHGIFEWKPVVLKARLFPADPIDIGAVLDEWESLGAVRRVDIGGKPHGMVRNFCRYQRPKNPSYRFELPEGSGDFIGLKQEDTPALPQEGVSPTEKPPQRKEEGGRMKEESETPGAEAPPPREKKSRKKPSVSISDDWKPDPQGVEYAKAHGLTDREAAREVERFRNNARQNDRRCADWPAAWRNWVLKSVEFLGRTPPSSEESSSSDLPGFYAAFSSDELVAWDRYERSVGKSTPRDKHGGWRFATQWPPGHESKSEAA